MTNETQTEELYDDELPSSENERMKEELPPTASGIALEAQARTGALRAHAAMSHTLPCRTRCHVHLH